MVQPANLNEIGHFLQSVISGFSDYLFFGFVLMVTFAVIFGIRALLIWGS